MDGDSRINNIVKSLPELGNPFELPCRIVLLTAELSVSLVIKDVWCKSATLLLSFGGWTLLCHVRTNMSVRRGIIWGISVHNIYKGEVLIFL